MNPKNTPAPPRPHRSTRHARGAVSRLGRWIAVAGAAVTAFAIAAVPVGSATAVTTELPTYRIAQQVAPPGTDAAGVAVDSDRGLVYVAGRYSSAVWVYDAGSLSLVATVPVPNQPYNIAVGPAGYVYVSQYTGSAAAGSLSVIDPDARAVVDTLPAGTAPVGVTVSPDGDLLYVGSTTGVNVYDLADPAAPAALPAIPISNVERVTVSTDGSTLYGAKSNSNAVSVIDAATGALLDTWTGLSAVHQVALSPDETRAYVSVQLGTAFPVVDLTAGSSEGAPSASVPLSSTYYQSQDAALGSLFVTQPFADGGSLGIIDSRSGTLSQSLAGVTGAYYTATDPTTHSTFVTSINYGSAVLTKVVPVGPTVTTQPVRQTVSEGEAATFTADADGTSPMTVQWQSSTDAVTWTDIAGATTGTYTTPPTALDQSVTLYRAVFTDPVGTAATVAAAVIVTPIPVAVTTDPADAAVTAGDPAEFAAAANGSAPIAVQWQTSTDDGATWTDIAGATDSAYTTPETTAEQSEDLFRAVFTGPGAGNQAITAAATLTVTTAPAAAPATPTPPSTPATPATPATPSSPVPSTDAAQSGDRLAETGSTALAGLFGLGALLTLAGLVLTSRRRRSGTVEH